VANEIPGFGDLNLFSLFLSIYEGCLFVCLSFFLFFFPHTSKSPNHGASCQALGIGGKPLMCKVVPSWFHNVLTYNGEVMNIEREKTNH